MVISTQNWSILTKFAKKKIERNQLFFTDCFFIWRSFPPKLPVRSANFSKNLPLKILRNLTFFAKIPQNRLIFCEFWLSPCEIGRFFRKFCLFLPRKSREIGRFFREFAPGNPVKFCFFFPRNMRSPVNGKSSLFLFGTTSYIYMPALPDTAQISQYAVWSTNLSHKIEFGAFFCFSLNFGKTCTVVFYQFLTVNTSC